MATCKMAEKLVVDGVDVFLPKSNLLFVVVFMASILEHDDFINS